MDSYKPRYDIHKNGEHSVSSFMILESFLSLDSGSGVVMGFKA